MTMRKLISGVLESISSGFSGPVNFLISYTSGKFHAANSQGESYTEIDPSVFGTSNINDIDYGADLTNPTSTTSVAWTTITSPLWFEGNLAGGGSAPRAAIEFANNTWVMGGYRQSATLFTSTDAVTWTTVNSNITFAEWFSVAYGNGLWIMVGNSGRLITSTDTVTWVTRTSNFSIRTIRGVAYGNGIWTAVGDYGNIRTSVDGSTWTTRTSNFGNSFCYSVAYNNGIWLVGGSGGQIRSSTDAITWVTRTSNFGNTSIWVVRNINGIWLAGGTTNQLRSSTDTITWTTVTNNAADSNTWYKQFKYNSLVGYLVFSSSLANQRIFRSTDLISWVTINTVPELGYLQNAANNGNRYVITHNNGGNNQNVIGNIMDISNIYTYPNNTFLAAGNNGTVGSSTNGISWTTINASMTTNISKISSGGGTPEEKNGLVWKRIASTNAPNTLNCIAYGNGLWLSGGNSSTLISSTNGISWVSRSSTNGPANFGNRDIRVLSYGNGVWLATGWYNSAASSTDGNTWTTRTLNFGNSTNIISAYGNSVWVAAGAAGQIRRSTDFITWTTGTVGVGNFGSAIITGLAYGNGLWAAASLAGDFATSTNGISWTTRQGAMGDAMTPRTKLTFDNNTWVAYGDYGLISSSTDAISWTTRTSNVSKVSTSNIVDIKYGNNFWYLTANLSNNSKLQTATSTDLITWVTRNDILKSFNMYGKLAYANGTWIAIDLSTSTNLAISRFLTSNKIYLLGGI